MYFGLRQKPNLFHAGQLSLVSLQFRSIVVVEVVVGGSVVDVVVVVVVVVVEMVVGGLVGALILSSARSFSLHEKQQFSLMK